MMNNMFIMFMFMLGGWFSSSVMLLVYAKPERFSTAAHSDGFGIRARFFSRHKILRSTTGTPGPKQLTCPPPVNHPAIRMRIAVALGTPLPEVPINEEEQQLERSKRDAPAQEAPAQEATILQELRDAQQDFKEAEVRAQFARVVDDIERNVLHSGMLLDDQLVAIHCKLMDFADAHPVYRRVVLEIRIAGRQSHVYDLHRIVNTIQRPRMALALEHNHLIGALKQALDTDRNNGQVYKLVNRLGRIIQGSSFNSRSKLPKVYEVLRAFIRANPDLKAQCMRAHIKHFGPLRSFYETAEVFWRVREIHLNHSRPDLNRLLRHYEDIIRDEPNPFMKKIVSELVKNLRAKPDATLKEWIEIIHKVYYPAFGKFHEFVLDMLNYVPFGELGNLFDVFFARYNEYDYLDFSYACEDEKHHIGS